jgi:DNA replication protein DnaC
VKNQDLAPRFFRCWRQGAIYFLKNLFRLNFIDEKSNVIFLGGFGLGKNNLATALGYQACLKGHTVLFCSAFDAINNLTAAQSAGRLKQELKKYHNPSNL